MPCHSSETDTEHDIEVARKLHITSITIALEAVFGLLLRVLPLGDYKPTNKKLAEANQNPELECSHCTTQQVS